jgi:hypothetical protein
MKPKQLLLWPEEYLEEMHCLPRDLTSRLTLRDLTSRVTLDYNFNDLREPLDFNELVNLVGDKYSAVKMPKHLLKSIGEYFNKDAGEVDFVDLTQMYYSIGRVLDWEINKLNLSKWRKANNLSFFGPEQYRLMGDYFKKKMGLI